MEDILDPTSLTNFNWDDTVKGDSDFFNFSNEGEEPKKEEEKEESVEETPEDKKSEESEEEPKEDAFADFRDPEEDEEEESSSTDKTTKSKSNKSTQSRGTYIEKFNAFKEEGLFKHVDFDDEEEELDEDRFKELLNEEYESEVHSRLSTWAEEELDEDAKAFIAFKQRGGRTQDFFKQVKEFNVLEGNIEDESFQKSVIREQLESEDWDEEEISYRLKTLEETGKLESVADKYYKRMKSKAEKERELLIKNQENSRRKAEESKREFKAELKNTLNSIREVKGIKITPKEKSAIYNFIANEDQDFGGKKVTGMQVAIANAVRDEEKRILLAKLLMSDFDMSDLEKQIKNKEVKKLKENLESRKDLRPGSSTGKGTQGRSLGEIFSQF